MWIVKNKIWAADIKIFINKPTRNPEGYWEDLTEVTKDRRYGYIIPSNEYHFDIDWENEPCKISFTKVLNLSEDDEPIYMMAESEKGPRDCDGDYNYGDCPLSKYSYNSPMTQKKVLNGSCHGFGCPGYAIKTTMRYLKMMGWEDDYKYYKTTKEIWDSI